jgi:hypothetical protein
LISHDQIIGVDQHEEFRAWAHDHPDYVHYIMMIAPPRPGAITFLVGLELYHFPPQTALNSVFECNFIELVPELGLVYGVASFPINYSKIAERLAPSLGLCPRKGFPAAFGPKGMVNFPIDTPHVYTLENVKNHPVYSMSSEEVRAAAMREFSLVRLIEQGQRPDLANFMKWIFE